MRWAHLSARSENDPPETAASAAPPLPLALPGATVRTFDTPDFAGMTFYEVRARTIINRVPGSSRVPFEWTINPYRGCSHACTYCLAGDTPILMADGTQRALERLRVGDTVYGTVGVGLHRRYVPTTVLDHWSTVKPAWRVRLADGTCLTASGDHRFLTDTGWRHVADDGTGRPHLRPGDRLPGVGRLADPPKDTPDYRSGYLYGLVRGDAALLRRRPRPGARGAERPTTAPRPARSAAPSAPRPAARSAAWQRADSYLRDVSLPRALRWPEQPAEDWLRGFVAGLFDAAGHVDAAGDLDGATAYLVSQDPELLRAAVDALTVLGLPVPAGRAAQGRVGIAAGAAGILRLHHATGIAGTPPPDLTGHPVRSAADQRVSAVEPVGLTRPLYDITTGTGDFVADGAVSHNCFARNTHTYLDLDPGHDFDSRVVVKVNAGALVRRELAAPRWRGQHIAMGTNVDCYQRAEGRYQLMPQILAALRDFANPFSVLTKGTLILRDLDLLRQAAAVTDVRLLFSVGFVDERHWRTAEPGTPSPRRRLDAVRTLTDAGFPVSVLMAPILPGLTDTAESIEQTVEAIAHAGAVSVTPLALHLRPGARQWYASWLAREHPHLVPRYRELFHGGSYLPDAYQREITARVRQAARRHGLGEAAPSATRQPADTDTPDTDTVAVGSGNGGTGPPAPATQQLRLL